MWRVPTVLRRRQGLARVRRDHALRDVVPMYRKSI